MHSHVQTQSLFDGKRLPTEIARVQRIRSVLRSDVVLQTAGLPKALVAMLTGVRSFVVVDAQMFPQIVRAHEVFIAHMADVPFAFLFLLGSRFLSVLRDAEFGRVPVGCDGRC